MTDVGHDQGSVASNLTQNSVPTWSGESARDVDSSTSETWSPFGGERRAAIAPSRVP
jgi:hypothetical protein